MKSRRSQSMFETIGVMFVFLILIAFGLIFYAKLRASSLDYDMKQLAGINSQNVFKRVISLPELQCSQNNVVTSNCIDKLKIEAFTELLDNDPTLKGTHYFDTFLYSTIKVYEIYPDETKSWTVYDYEPERWVGKDVTRVPISLLDHTSNKKSFGVIEVAVYT